MTGSIDRILDVVDAGLQRSSEVGGDGGDPSRCWRCRVYDPVEGSRSGLCAPCRAFLLEEGPDPLAADGLIATVDAEIFRRLQERILEGDGTGIPVGLAADLDRIRDAVEPIVEAMADLARRILDAFSRVDWSALLELAERFEPPRRAPAARRTLAPRRRRGLATHPPRDLRSTEGPRPAPTPRRKTP